MPWNTPMHTHWHNPFQTKYNRPFLFKFSIDVKRTVSNKGPGSKKSKFDMTLNGHSPFKIKIWVKILRIDESRKIKAIYNFRISLTLVLMLKGSRWRESEVSSFGWSIDYNYGWSIISHLLCFVWLSLKPSSNVLLNKGLLWLLCRM